MSCVSSVKPTVLLDTTDTIHDLGDKLARSVAHILVFDQSSFHEEAQKMFNKAHRSLLIFTYVVLAFNQAACFIRDTDCHA